jgi:hypothetical protein
VPISRRVAVIIIGTESLIDRGLYRQHATNDSADTASEVIHRIEGDLYRRPKFLTADAWTLPLIPWTFPRSENSPITENQWVTEFRLWALPRFSNIENQIAFLVACRR